MRELLKDLIDNEAPVSEKFLVNVGCGHDYRAGWKNVDLYEPTADIKADARELPFPDDSVDVLLADQVLEHFPFEEGKKALREWKRVIKPGGEIVISVPDMDQAVKVCADFPPELRAAMMWWFYGTQNGPGQVHMSGYTPTSLQKTLEQEGFEVIWLDYNTPRRPTPSVRIVGVKR